jgi:cell division protease FtsH
MSEELGKLTYGRPMMSPFLKSPFEAEERNYSERTAETIDNESRRILDEIYQRVTDILLQRRDPLILISKELIRKETLERAELDRLLTPPDRRTEGDKLPVGAGVE